jgi:hypothetical protein
LERAVPSSNHFILGILLILKLIFEVNVIVRY